jgi:ectoine hydroxylase-related dioxygenase (phytanoyl-CoA dioxygenase family)
MLSAMAHPLLADLIAWQPAQAVLGEMGFPRPTFTDGYIISKPPHSPRLFWHYDWFAWQDSSAYDEQPQQVFLMYYLTDTSRQNGCLRVLPGSHRQHNELHDLIDNPHTESLSRVTDPDHPAFSDRVDEIDVPVHAGDLVIGDARLLHAAHANASAERRTVVTLWFQPDFSSLPERIQAQMVRKTHPIPADWPETAAAKVAALLPHYEGTAEPYGRDLYQRRPD